MALMYLMNKLDAQEQLKNTLDNAQIDHVFMDALKDDIRNIPDKPGDLMFAHTVLVAKQVTTEQIGQLTELVKNVAQRSDDVNQVSCIVGGNDEEGVVVYSYFGKKL